jgi:adenylate kinase
MDKQFFILLGRSGSGKGTQAALLKTLLEARHGRQVIHITTGGGFRDFIAQEKYASRLAKEINDTGGLQPEFLAVWNWSNIFINTLQGEESVILDGAPRKPFEATILHSAIEFFRYKNPIVIYLDVSESGSRGHLAKRGREDDLKEEQVASRMSWFETDVLPALEVYRNDPRYQVLHVNGNQTIDEVHQEIVEKLGQLA